MKKYLLCVAAIATITSPALAQNEEGGFAKDGFRLEARATYETPTVSSVNTNNDVYKLGSAFGFGAEAGFDIKVSNNFVVGPYVNYEKSGVKNCDGLDCVEARDNFAAGLNLGLGLSDKGQIYGKLGYSKLRLTSDIGVAGPGGVTRVVVNDSGEGPEFALGYDHSFGKNFYGRVEFGYADVGKIYGINFQRRHAGISLGVRF